MNNISTILAIALTIVLVSCGSETESNDSTSTHTSKIFELLNSTETGINFKNQLNDDPMGDNNVLSFPHYYNGAGVAIGDINNDNLPDIFFSGNEVPNKLYLNKGNLKFEDISDKAQINKNKVWSTGATMADVNGDGYLDIYVCQYGPNTYNKRKNRLYINNGDLTFKESAEAYGLDDGNESIQAAFFDYDMDGDLDCYVMNESKYVRVLYKEVFKELQDKRNLEAASGNLFRNDGQKFTRVTEEAGMLKYGFGLGLAISDINKDGLPDVYVANDYSVPDFMYINNGDGTFTDKQKEFTKQVSFFGMGVDIADINNDALADIAVVDMATSDHFRGKTLMASMDVAGFKYFVNDLGYQHQYMFNSFQLNNGNNTFSNIANMAGVAKSDWSWATLLADYDNDGYNDYFVTNGFRRYSRDNDFMNKMSATREANGGNIPMALRKELYEEMPQVQLPNIMYHNQKDLTFKEVQTSWGLSEATYSNGAAYADLDLDGDLELIISNIDQPAYIYKNNAREANQNNYLGVKLKRSNNASPLAGTKVTIHYNNGEKQYREWMNTRGYQSTVDEVLHFGLGKTNSINKVEVIWPNNTVQTIDNIKVNQVLTVSESANLPKHNYQNQQRKTSIEQVSASQLGIDFKHQENAFNDFAKEVLLPHKQSTLGPFISVADVNEDGLDDFFVGGASGQAGTLYLQNKNSTFSKAPNQPWQQDINSEDMQAVFFDPDNNGRPDLFIPSGGGGEMEGQNDLLQDRIYINTGGGKFQKATGVFANMQASAAIAKAADFNQDGGQDLFVGGQGVPGQYPYASRSYLLQNLGGKFADVTPANAPALETPGIVKDFIWTNLNNDKFPDLVVVGEWMPISFFINEQGSFKNVTEQYGTADLKGWWYSIEAMDVDNDGDEDYVVGNIGTNTKFHASKKKPFIVYADDFDGNGTNDVVLTKEYKGELVPSRGRQCSSEQMPFIEDKFPTYAEFANAGIDDILGEDKIKNALELKATEFHSLVLINDGNGKFSHKYLPNEAQIAPINGIISLDINKDGNLDLIVAGNNYDTEVETPRYDASNGLVLMGKGDGTFEPQSIQESGFYAPGNVKDIKLLNLADKSKLLLVTNNNGPMEAFKIK